MCGNHNIIISLLIKINKIFKKKQFKYKFNTNSIVFLIGQMKLKNFKGPVFKIMFWAPTLWNLASNKLNAIFVLNSMVQPNFPNYQEESNSQCHLLFTSYVL